MRKKRLLTLCLVALFALYPVGIVLADYLTCDHYMVLTVANTSGTDYTYERIKYDLNASSLTSVNLIQSDADDSFLMESTTELEHSALDMTSATSTWLGYIDSVPAYSSNEIRLYIDDPSAAGREQEWLADADDTFTVTDNASLDITTNLTLSADTYISELPSSEQYFIQKADAYELGVDDTNYFFNLTLAAQTETLRPNAAGSTTGLEEVVGAATHWEAVDEESADDTTSYVYDTRASNYADTYNITNTSIPAGSTINSVTVYYRVWRNYGTSKAAGGVYLNGTTVWDSWREPSLSAWTTYSASLSRPGGGSWTQSDLDSLQVGVQLWNPDAGHETRCTQVYAVVDYTELPGITCAATTGATKDVRGTYDGSNIKLYVDDVEEASESLTGNIDTNANNVVVDVDGIIDNVRIGDTSVVTPTWHLDLEFEAGQVDNTTITDQSASTNDATYSLAGMDAGVTVTVGPIVSTTSYISSDPASAAPEVMGDIGTPTNWMATGTGSTLPGYELFQAAAGPLGFSTNILFSIAMIIVATVIGISAAAATGSTMVGMAAIGVMLLAGSTTGVLSMWILFVYLIFAGTYVVASRSM